MVPLVRAISALADSGLGPYAIVGGVAVNARLGRAHRATADVDTVVDVHNSAARRRPSPLSRADAEPDPTGAHRVYIGGTKVEVLGVAPLGEADLEGMPEDDALFVAGHSWATWRRQPS